MRWAINGLLRMLHMWKLVAFITALYIIAYAPFDDIQVHLMANKLMEGMEKNETVVTVEG